MTDPDFAFLMYTLAALFFGSALCFALDDVWPSVVRLYVRARTALSTWLGWGVVSADRRSAEVPRKASTKRR